MAEATNNGKKGGLLRGKPHSKGGIKAVVTDSNQMVELEGGEVIINKEASKKHWKELSRINQSAGGGVPILPPNDSDADPDEYGKGGTITFNPNHLPSKWMYQYAKKIKDNYPKVWDVGGNVFGNEAFKNLERVLNRGYWTDSEEWMYKKWQSFNARHSGDIRIAGIIANLKWLNKVDKGWAYMKDLIEEEIAKKYPDKKAKGGSVDKEDGSGVRNFMKWYVKWYKGISDEMSINIVLPSVIAPYKEDNVAILENFEKIKQGIDAKPYLKKILSKADECGVTIYLEPTPRHNRFLNNTEKRKKITKEYLVSYYKSFGFELTNDGRFMKHLPSKSSYAKGGSVEPKLHLSEIKYYRSKGKIANTGLKGKGGVVIYYTLSDGKKELLKISSTYISLKASNSRSSGKTPPYAPKLKGALQFFKKYGYDLPIDADKDYGNEFFDLEITPNLLYSKIISDYPLNVFTDTTEAPYIHPDLKKKMAGGGVVTYKQKFNKKYGFNKDESHTLSEVAKETGRSKKGLQQIYNKGIGAYKTNPESVRPNVKSKEQWAMARVYSAVMGGKTARIDAKELAMAKGGVTLPPEGTLISKDKKSKLDYKKTGNNFEFSVYDGEPNPVENYSRVQFKKRNGNKVIMTYEQFINYIYTEGFVDDKAKGGELVKGMKEEREHRTTAEKLYNRQITPSQAPKSIAKEHLEEDPHYYSKLEKLKTIPYAKGGMTGGSTFNYKKAISLLRGGVKIGNTSWSSGQFVTRDSNGFLVDNSGNKENFDKLFNSGEPNGFYVIDENTPKQHHKNKLLGDDDDKKHLIHLKHKLKDDDGGDDDGGDDDGGDDDGGDDDSPKPQVQFFTLNDPNDPNPIPDSVEQNLFAVFTSESMATTSYDINEPIRIVFKNIVSGSNGKYVETIEVYYPLKEVVKYITNGLWKPYGEEQEPKEQKPKEKKSEQKQPKPSAPKPPKKKEQKPPKKKFDTSEAMRKYLKTSNVNNVSVDSPQSIAKEIATQFSITMEGLNDEIARAVNKGVEQLQNT